MSSLPWLIGGDFNEILRLDEKEGGAARPPFLINNFHEVLDSCDLGDLGCSGNRFTWCNGRKGVGFVKERLDRFVGNLAWRLLFPIFMVSHLEFWGSDHCPILIEFDVCEHRRHRFHFEECWTVYPECEKIVQQNWGSCSSAKSLAAVSAQICNCAEVLQVWNRTNFHHLKNKIAEKRHILQSVSSDLSGSSWQTIQVVEKELDVLLSKEELYWRQRSRNNWLKGGDRNTRFFHQAASSRRRRNFIHGLRDSSRQWVSSRSGIIGIIQGYYRSLFTSATGRPESVNEILSSVRNRVSISMNRLLDASFTAQEVRTAVFQLPPSKAPGKDGMSACFFQKYWAIVGNGVTDACLGFLNTGEGIEAINATLIALIPKTQAPQRISDFKPISLCNVVYKIIAKVLVNRLRLVLNEIISESQSAFIPGRLITDNAILGFECLHALKRRKKGTVGSLALKLDMSKAYDRVEWSFVCSMMRVMGFSENWIRKIQACISSVTYQFLLNG
ncbi:hypothetical protein ACOSP7_002843 [Xanthoceras sorbifolium]